MPPARINFRAEGDEKQVIDLEWPYRKIESKCIVLKFCLPCLHGHNIYTTFTGASACRLACMISMEAA